MIMRQSARSAVIGVALLLTACAVGPDYHAPSPPSVATLTKQPLPNATEAAPLAGGDAQRFVPGSDVPEEWWRSFHSDALNALINESLRANPDLKSAQAALRAAMENVRAQIGAYYPQIGVGFSATRAKDAQQLSPVLVSPILLYNLYQAQLNVSWTLDIFGANRRQVESLQAMADAERYQLEATRVALVTNVIAAAIGEASLRAQIAAEKDVIESERDALKIMQRQNTAGQIAGAAVAAQEAALAQAEQILPPLQKQLSQQRDLLTALAGRLPAEEVEQSFELDALQLPQELPVAMPAQLVERRPDIRIAAEQLHAASAQIGVAVANRLPNITLTAGAGTAATTLGQLFQPGNGFWSLASGLVQPVFQGGTLLHRERAAEAAYDQASANYQKAVVTAFQQVADVLYALQSDADALKAAVATETAATRSLNIARRQLELGQIAYIGLLTAQQTYQQAVINRVVVQASRYADSAALFQALGGRWNEVPNDVASNTETAVKK